jgi:NAD(P)-dependent dehydrogenase (short-subunit alcohol dehydrogenase family)
VTAPEMNSEMSSQMSDQYVYFFDDAEFVETDRDGFRRRVMIGDHLEFWFWRIKGGADGSILHKHDSNEQLGIIMRGTLDFRIGDPDELVGPALLLCSDAGSFVTGEVVTVDGGATA